MLTILSGENILVARSIQELIFLWSIFNESITTWTDYKTKQNHLDRSPPADNQGHTVLPAEAAGVHIWAKTDVIPGHVCDSLLWGDVKYLHTLENKRALTYSTGEKKSIGKHCSTPLTTSSAEHGQCLLSPAGAMQRKMLLFHTELWAPRTRENLHAFLHKSVLLVDSIGGSNTTQMWNVQTSTSAFPKWQTSNISNCVPFHSLQNEVCFSETLWHWKSTAHRKLHLTFKIVKWKHGASS